MYKFEATLTLSKKEDNDKLVELTRIPLEPVTKNGREHHTMFESTAKLTARSIAMACARHVADELNSQYGAADLLVAPPVFITEEENVATGKLLNLSFGFVSSHIIFDEVKVKPEELVAVVDVKYYKA